MSLKFRIALTVFILEAIMVGLVLWQTLGLTLDKTTEQIDRTDRVVLNLLSEIGKVSIITREFEDMQIHFENALRGPHVSAVHLLNRDGRVVASNDTQMIGQAMPPVRDTALNYWRRQEIRGSSGKIGAIAVNFSNAPLHRANAEARNLGLKVAAIGMAIIAAAGLFMGFVLSRRLEKLAQAADRAASGDYSGKAEIGGGDEVARVGRSFDLMLDQTRRSITAMEDELAEHKRTETALRESEASLENAQRIAQIGDWQ